MYNIHKLPLFKAWMYAGAVPQSIYEASHHLESLLKKKLFLHLKCLVSSVF